MTTEEFNRLVHERCEKIQAVLAAKSTEYARGDRLSNFKRAATKHRCTPEKALLGMSVKHDISILDMVEDLDHERMAPFERWEEKIGDHINYLILLEGLVRERIQQRDQTSQTLEHAIRNVERLSKRKR